MPTISVFYGIVIMMRQKSKEHEPPHIHAWYGGKDAAFLISTGEILYGNLPNRAKNMIREFILKYQDELLAMWNGAPFKKLKGLD